MFEYLREKIEKNEFNVEDIVKFAVDYNVDGISFLSSSIEEFSWKGIEDENDENVPPYKTWALIVISYLESGFLGLDKYVTSEEGGYLDTATFVIAILDDIKTSESVECLVNLFGEIIENPAKNHELSRILIKAFNIILSFSKDINLKASDKIVIREFIYKYLALFGSVDSDRASAFCALRGVGDNESIKKIKNYPKLGNPYKGIEKIIIKEIKARL